MDWLFEFVGNVLDKGGRVCVRPVVVVLFGGGRVLLVVLYSEHRVYGVLNGHIGIPIGIGIGIALTIVVQIGFDP